MQRLLVWLGAPLASTHPLPACLPCRSGAGRGARPGAHPRQPGARLALQCGRAARPGCRREDARQAGGRQLQRRGGALLAGAAGPPAGRHGGVAHARHARAAGFYQVRGLARAGWRGCCRSADGAQGWAGGVQGAWREQASPWCAALQGAWREQARPCCAALHSPRVISHQLLPSACRVWNYARTPARGVQQLEIYLDEQLVWKVRCGGAVGGAGRPSAGLLDDACYPRMWPFVLACAAA